jgi:uncharacterized protein YqjF (DUF2071 family)
VPAAFELDLFEGEAWIGVVPFHMTNVAPRGLPSLPYLSRFAELNVRTYVRAAGRPGVYFFSLDASRAIAVTAARVLFNLPYHVATMTVEADRAIVTYRSQRRSDRTAQFSATYEPDGPSFTARPGSLEYFLTERYCLYNLTRAGSPYRLDIHHPPWPLQLATAALERNTMPEVNGVRCCDSRPLLHFVKRQDMVMWPPVRVSN